MATASRKPASITFESLMRNVSAGIFAPIYFLMGDESYFIDRIEQAIVSHALPPEERDFNLITLFGAETTIDEVIATAKGFPMGADHLLVVVKEAQNLKNLERLEYYLKMPQPSTILVFCHKNKSIDRRLKVAALIANQGVMFESKKLYENQLPTFCSSYLRERGMSIEPQAAVMMAEFIGSDLNRLAGELDKLMVVKTPETATITTDMVLTNIGISKEYNIFEFLDAIAQKDVVKANRIANYFEANPNANPIQATLHQLFRFFSNLMLAFYSPDQSERGLASWLGQTEWQVKRNVMPAMRNFRATKVMYILSEIRRTDARSKGVDNPFIPAGELLKELIYYILH